ncbi:glycoside hydrolase family protein [Flammeovirga sp. EKP202]|uniref:glycoside hydrolase family protein n=1 Tax=Flammeovirga sp. EKP202 TaxID=2770592 RepID=UPI00165F1AF7|nr:glycoside hydrolase family protein [Flammeovirga sp. EKP202]MBD0400643.1 glycoside hydrolase family protein [Flammeovirga sp. EKP202]
MTTTNLSVLLFFCFIITSTSFCQDVERKLPDGWENIVYGGRFMDRFAPLPKIEEKTSETWGAQGVKPRYIKNGIEDPTWSYWGGNIRLLEDNKYHLFVCRWAENAVKGHKEWQRSNVVHAVADHRFGPYSVVNEVGKGHNPEWFITKEGKFVIYVIKGFYIADSVNGPWKYHNIDFDPRDRAVIERLSNLSFAKREDGSMLMVCRGGGIWVSKNGVSTWYQVSNRSVYPKVEGRFEDPVVWKDHVQYHLIVNDWLGRIAWFLRSKDGVHWTVDDGQAYQPGIAFYNDETKENWYKFERMKVLQDEYGRAIQANFAVIDTLKKQDLGNDNHSSKNISIPLKVGRLITIQNEKRIDVKTKKIILEIKAEEGFNPNTDLDLSSLRLGASEEVNYGRGAKAIKIQAKGNNAIITFDGKGNGITNEHFAAKLLGKYKNGKLLFGYSRLPKVAYQEALLSTLKPKIINEHEVEIEVQNFGQVNSNKSNIKIETVRYNKTIKLGKTIIPPLKPFEKVNIKINTKEPISRDSKNNFIVTIDDDQKTVFGNLNTL